MSKNNDQVYYAVGRGKEVGIYGSWKECKTQIDGISDAKYRKFFSIQEAQEFVDFWKNYSSPAHEKPESPSLVSTQKNWGDFRLNGRKKFNNRRQAFHVTNQRHERDSNCSKKFKVKHSKQTSDHVNKWSTPVFCRRSDILLGVNSKTEEKPVAKLSPFYTSPLPSVRSLPFDRGNGKNKTCDRSVSQDVIECIEIVDIKRSNSVDDVSALETVPNETQNVFSSSCENVSLTRNNVCSVSENESRLDKEVGVVTKTEIIETEQRNETEISRNTDNDLSEINEKIATCLNLLESTFKLLTNRESDNGRSVKKSFQLLLQKIISGINISINPQMDVEDSAGRKDESSESANCVNNTSEPQPPLPAPRSSVSKETEQSPKTPKTSPVERRTESKNVDVLALTLRLDAFEKRFDSCLKEMGALTSEMSHIKSEMKEIKEAIGSGTYSSPGKSGGGLQQSTLKFSSPKKLEFSSPSRSYSTSTNKSNSSSMEPAAKRGRTLKRKRSRSDSGEESETCEDILSKIKVEAVDYTSFSVDADEYVEVYTDGACRSNGKTGAKAGIGVWWGDNHPLNVSEPVDGSATNNAAEIQAARIAVELAVKAGLSRLKVCTDSGFLIDCITKWIHKWKKNNWTLVNGGKVKNKKEFEKLDKVASKIKVRWEKVEAHTGIYGNEMADRLANEGAEKYQR